MWKSALYAHGSTQCRLLITIAGLCAITITLNCGSYTGGGCYGADLKNREDRIIVHCHGDKAVMDVFSPGGLGFAKIWRETGKMGEIVLRFRYEEKRCFRRLEGLVIHTDMATFSTGLGQADRVRAGGRGDGGIFAIIPVRGHPDYIEASISAETAALVSDTLSVSWVDMYRK